jgi:tetrapyrrole methylase family protein/MazG family protein/ATP diphosphatase
MGGLKGAGDSTPRLVSLVRRLRGPDGCPWDRQQTLATLRPHLLDEAYEVADAIDAGDLDALREELGDLLMLVVSCAEIAQQEGRFGFDDVVDGVCAKLVRRHPHVFGDADARARGARDGDWERLKALEKPDRGPLDGVPRSLPALTRAVRVGREAAALGYDWADAAGVRSKVSEELAELDAAPDDQDAERELGDLLFAIASLARKRGFDPEAALRGSLDRFAQRLEHVCAVATAEGVRLPELDEQSRDARWDEAKRAKSPR